MDTRTAALGLIGSTPLVELTRFDTGPCRLFLKLEMNNPGGSIKDRTALAMIEAAESQERIHPGSLLVEATAGNTGLGLALVAAAKGYRLALVIPDKMSREKVMHLRALGAEVIMTRSDVPKGHPEYYHELAERLASERGGYYVNQFANPANPYAHETTTAPELWEQMEHRLDAVVLGVGSGGTVTGFGRFLSRVSPKTKVILADPRGSVLVNAVRKKPLGEAGSWYVEGIGEDFIPSNLDVDYLDEAIEVSDQESFSAARALLEKETILAGSSTGTLLHAALVYCRRQSEPLRVATLACDTGNKYLSKMFDDDWMRKHGFEVAESDSLKGDMS